MNRNEAWWPTPAMVLFFAFTTGSLIQHWVDHARIRKLEAAVAFGTKSTIYFDGRDPLTEETNAIDLNREEIRKLRDHVEFLAKRRAKAEAEPQQ